MERRSLASTVAPAPQQLRWPDDLDPPDVGSPGITSTGITSTGITSPGITSPGTTPPGDDCCDDLTDDRRGPGSSEPIIEVRTSTRRRKTASAHWEGDRIVVLMPAGMSRRRHDELVDWLVQRLLSKRPQVGESDAMLARRAEQLAARYVPQARPARIRWVTNQSKRWASCSATTREIRISHRLRQVPEWVLDATIVHELAHLVHADHGPDFHRLADRHPRQGDATTFLEGYLLGLQSGQGADISAGPRP